MGVLSYNENNAHGNENISQFCSTRVNVSLKMSKMLDTRPFNLQSV